MCRLAQARRSQKSGFSKFLRYVAPNFSQYTRESLEYVPKHTKKPHNMRIHTLHAFAPCAKNASNPNPTTPHYEKTNHSPRPSASSSRRILSAPAVACLRESIRAGTAKRDETKSRPTSA